MDKMSIVSSQAVLEMSSFSVDTRSMSSSPLVKNRLFKTAPDIDELPFQFIHTMDLSVVDSPDLVIHRTEIWAVWRPHVGRKISLVLFDAAFNCCTCGARCADALSCWKKVVTRHSAYRWQQYDTTVTSWSNINKVSKRYHQNFLLCNNNEITACIADLFDSFCEEVYAVTLFKVVQQQTIGKVENSITYLWADNFCLQQWNFVKELLNSDHVCESYAHIKKVQFFCLTMYLVTISERILRHVGLRGLSVTHNGPIYFKYSPQCSNFWAGNACCASHCIFSW